MPRSASFAGTIPGRWRSGTLFGVRYPILDMVPKISRAMKIPSFWVQPAWRDGRIHFEIEQLPMAEEDETNESWCARWAQDYLDRLARLMSSSPEILALHTHPWRFLLLSGLGPKAVQHFRDTVPG